MSSARHWRWSGLFASALIGISVFAQQPGPTEIIERSVEANERDWDAAPGYDYFLREQDGKNSRTYEIMMLYGSRYSRLVAINDKPLSSEEEARERQQVEAAVAQRERETPEQRKRRIAQYQQDRDREHVLMGELTKAFDFTLAGREVLGAYQVYVLKGTPRRGYRPPNKEAKALTGMEGTLWIDTATFHWVKVEAAAVRPIWIQGFFARVQPGTRFSLEQMPIAEELWMPNHFSLQTKAKVLFLFPHNERKNEAYFGYHKPGTTPAGNAAMPPKDGEN